MTAILIQSQKPNDNNRGEKAMLAFLQALPETYFVYRELQVVPSNFEKQYGVPYRTPDFVIVSPDYGLVIIEVKDWNILQNEFYWRDQRWVVKKPRDGKPEEDILNPFAQANNYRHAFEDLMKMELGFRLPISALVAFPLLSRQGFMNAFEKSHQLKIPQAQHLFDFDKAIFKEEIDQFRLQPLKVFAGRTQPASPALNTYQFDTVNRTLIPPKFVIGDLTALREGRNKLRILSEKQQKWAFDLSSPANYLLDVAGSGKTNVLVSRAIATVQRGIGGRTPRILLTTYNRTLAKSIRNIIVGKLESAPALRQLINDQIVVLGIPDLLQAIYKEAYGESMVDKPGEAVEQFESRLLAEVIEVLRNDKTGQLKKWDAVFIDEIQDFTDDFLRICKGVCRTNNFFFVGDVGQRIYERHHHLQALGLVTDQISLDKTYRMYRTPRRISQLAVQFVNTDLQTRQEFEQHGYKQDATFLSPIDFGAELLRADDVIGDAVNRINDHLAHGASPADFLIICSAEKLETMAAALSKAAIPLQNRDSAQGVTLIDFVDVKGLEGGIVIIVGIEDLPHRSSPNLLFADLEVRLRQERRSRRLIYVALTRTLENAIVFYTDPTNRYIAELLEINQKIARQRLVKQV